MSKVKGLTLRVVSLGQPRNDCREVGSGLALKLDVIGVEDCRLGAGQQVA